jgi:hypothetical protein
MVCLRNNHSMSLPTPCGFEFTKIASSTCSDEFAGSGQIGAMVRKLKHVHCPRKSSSGHLCHGIAARRTLRATRAATSPTGPASALPISDHNSVPRQAPPVLLAAPHLRSDAPPQPPSIPRVGPRPIPQPPADCTIPQAVLESASGRSSRRGRHGCFSDVLGDRPFRGRP